MITTTVDFLSFTHIPPIHLQQIYSILYLTLRSKSSPKDYAFTNALRVYLIERSESSPKDYVIVLTTFDRIKEMWYTLCKK